MEWISVCLFLLAGTVAVDAACGEPEVQGLRVIGGHDAVRGSWPWQILLLDDLDPSCGGTIISPRWVVTAAHCVYGSEDKPEKFIVMVGEHKWEVFTGSEVEHEVEKIIRHDDFNSPTMLNNDIALLKLKSPVVFNKYVKPACLPSGEAPVGSECYITGWGKITHPGDMYNILQQGRLPVVSNEVCKDKNSKVLPFPLTDKMLCAGSGGSSDLSGCHGDSGGPFVCLINGKWELQGAVSHGSSSCSSAESYTVFADVYHFKGWILDNMAEN